MYEYDENKRVVRVIDTWTVTDVWVQEQYISDEEFGDKVLTDDDRWEILKRAIRSAELMEEPLSCGIVYREILNYLDTTVSDDPSSNTGDDPSPNTGDDPSPIRP